LSPGARVELRCKGRGCPFAKRVAKVRRNHSANLRRLIKRRLRAGAVLEVRLTAPGTIGRVTRFRLRKGHPPKKVNLCLPPGAKTPARCT
jgi:hypothetical protein